VDVPYSSEQGSKKRPVVVVSIPDYFRCRKDVIVLEISSAVEKANCDTDYILHDWRDAGLEKPSFVKCNPITVFYGELQTYIGRLSDDDLNEVRNRLRKALGFE